MAEPDVDIENADDPKQGALNVGIQDAQHAPSVAFPDVANSAPGGQESRHHYPRPRGVELRRELTIEEKALAQAGYDHLDSNLKTAGPDSRTKAKADSFQNVTIHEHALAFDALARELETSLNTKEPGKSQGLTDEEAKARLERDGRNVLSPPKKKSALRKVLSTFLSMSYA